MQTKTTALAQLKDSIQTLAPEFKKVLPSMIDPKKFIRICITAITTEPKLVGANRITLLAACMKAAEDGLMPDGRESALVVYNTRRGPEAVYMPMYKGLIKKALKSGDILSIKAKVVFEQDEFDYWTDENGEHLTHRPELYKKRGDLTHVYATAKTKEKEVYVEVMNVTEVEKVRNSSKAKDSGPWTDWWDEMAKKTAIRKLCKLLPMSDDLEQVIQSDDATYDLDATEPTAGRTPKRKSRVESLVLGEGKAGDEKNVGEKSDVSQDTDPSQEKIDAKPISAPPTQDEVDPHELPEHKEVTK